jgi:predicted DNA-binding protein (MmcQ/YjbR family)
MNVDGVKAFCRTFSGATEKNIAPPINVLSYRVGEKKFAYFKTSEPEQWRFSVRVSVDRFIELTDQPGVKPAKYMGRFRWVTIVDVDDFHEDYLMALIESSYETAFRSRPKKQQREIFG